MGFFSILDNLLDCLPIRESAYAFEWLALKYQQEPKVLEGACLSGPEKLAVLKLGRRVTKSLSNEVDSMLRGRVALLVAK